ncbi:MAG: phage terminase large subunit [Atribacterota bacterium]|nr:phage terminase large subunit [Atribacterota bacterium]
MAELTLKPTLKQHQAYEALKVCDEVFFGGGAGGGKSWWICESRLEKAVRYPGYRSFIGRKELKRLMQSTFITWGKVCAFHGIDSRTWKLNGQYNYIEFTNGSRIDLLDLALLPGDALYERLGSLEYTDGAIEEAGEIPFMAVDVLRSRIGRHMNAEYNIPPTLAISGNPSKNWTYKEFYKPWKEKTLPENVAFIQSLYHDNPFTADKYGQQLSLIKSVSTRERLKFGNWEYDDDPGKLIEYDHIIDLFTNTIEKVQERYLTSDIARFGGDKIVIYCWQGFELYKVIVKEKQSLETTKTDIRGILKDEFIPFSHTIVDEDGVGGGLVDGLPGIKGFVANSTPLKNPVSEEKENYKNLKAQCSYMAADYINYHKISITAEIEPKYREQFIEDLDIAIRGQDVEKDAPKQIVPKEKTKDILGRSPDFADAFIQRMYFVLKEETVQIAPDYSQHKRGEKYKYPIRKQ